MQPQSSNLFNEVEHTVAKRSNNLKYLQKIFSVGSFDSHTEVFWMNIFRITPAVVETVCRSSSLRRQVEGWWCLGVSLAQLQEYPAGPLYVRACLQLCEEYTFHHGSSLSQNMKSLRAVVADTLSAEDLLPVTSSSISIKPRLLKSSGQVIYQHYVALRPPCLLDPVQVILSVAEMLLFTYRKMLDESSADPSLHDVIIHKLDRFYKHHFFGYLSRQLNKVCMAAMQTELRALFAIFNGSMAADIEGQAMSDDDDDAGSDRSE